METFFKVLFSFQPHPVGYAASWNVCFKRTEWMGNRFPQANAAINRKTNKMELINETICSEEIYGPKRDELYIVLPISVIYLVIFITGTVGNITTCIVIYRNKSLHTATNYYLFSLAVSDLVLLVSGLPQEIYLIWSR